MLSPGQLRWLTMGVFAVSSALNYLDRLLLSALGLTLSTEFQLSREQFGLLLSAFYLPYALASPLMGLLLDRIGLTVGACLIVGLWSFAGMSTALVGSFGTLLLCRAALGLAESGGIPATAKASATYLAPRDRALGSALSQVGLTVGSVLAPPLFAASIAPRYGWRAAFFVAGAMGLLWIPLWLWYSGKVRPLVVADDPKQISVGSILSDRRFLALLVANILAMTVYSLWTGWTTLFLADVYKISERTVNLNYAWIPPIAATLGGLFGGWIAQRWIKGRHNLLRVRLQVALLGGLLSVVTGLSPFAPTPLLATAGIALGLFSVTCLSVNYYSIPLDLFGPERAAFGVSFLTGAFGLMQVFLSPWIGRWCVAYGWATVCSAIALLPLLSVGVLWFSFRDSL